MIAVPANLLAHTFSIFRACGAARRECIAYWLGPAASPSVVTEVVHPQHASAGGGYQIDDAWLTAFLFDLARHSESVRVQVHTHPRAAFHSATDDDWALVHTAGFLSLVIPDFAMGPVGLERAYLAEYTVVGGWRRIPAGSRLRIVP